MAKLEFSNRLLRFWNWSSMTDVYWLEQTEANLPTGNDWLSHSEAARLNSIRFAKRGADWRLGRWTAKLALTAYRNLPADPQTLRNIEILPASSGAPEVFFENQPAAVIISLSHRDGIAVCAVAHSGVVLGCDLEVVEPRTDGFVSDYFTETEQRLVARAAAADRPELLALLWSGKESALKALREGLRLDTRSAEVALDEVEGSSGEQRVGQVGDSALSPRPYGANRWLPFHVRCTSGQVFHGWWQSTENLVRTLVAAPPPAPPILLRSP